MPLPDPKDRFLHFEYTNLQTQRAALTGYIQLWHNIGWPAALLVWVNLALSNLCWGAWVAAVIATAIVIYVRIHSHYLDCSIRKLYPRIVFLELWLGFRFYRDYIRSKGPSEKTWVEKREALYTDTDNEEEIMSKINSNFRPKEFSQWRRGHRGLDIAALIMILFFFAFAALQSLYCGFLNCN